MKKLLLLALMMPLCLFAKDEGRSSFYYPHRTNTSTSIKHSHKKRISFGKFWNYMDYGDYRSAYNELSKMKPKTADDKRFVQLCRIHIRSIVEQLMQEDCS